MGTNFYWKMGGVSTSPTGEAISVAYDDPAIHIGKRSAAGWYCYSCDLTLCEGGKAGLHTGLYGFHESCPSCGRTKPELDVLRRGAAAIELGFSEPEPIRPDGVFTASSFSWAQDPESVGVVCEKRPDEELIEDEYGRALTGRAFMDMIRANCPVQFTDHIGAAFS